MIRAITIDLDETLWPVAPVIAKAEAALVAWMRANAPVVAERFPPPVMRALRDEIITQIEPHRQSDMGHVRRTAIAHALHAVGDDPAKAHEAYAVFDAARQEVELFADAIPALIALGARYPILALSNGTADIHRTGLGHHFVGAVSAAEIGISKPDARIFHAACERLGYVPAEVLHIGDDPLLDVEGALAAGMKAVWLNRSGAAWRGTGRPDRIANGLADIPKWLVGDT
ncbi:MAG: HAD family hydrolase [Betaproteobacteria bacterium]|nr:HAD family hydrolase [Betaproteobacteria bacterium]